MPAKNAVIEIRGAKTNNLKNIDLDLPIGSLTVITGVSGSGKSSLLFDTLYAESYRRYLDSLSSFARQYMRMLPKPDVTELTNLPPAIAVRQNRMKTNNRSTVATLTELHSILQHLFTQLSSVHCPDCRRSLSLYTDELLVKALPELTHSSEFVLVCAELSRWKQLSAKQLLVQLRESGFARILLDGRLCEVDELAEKNRSRASVVVDRFSSLEIDQDRMKESVRLAFKLGEGRIVLITDSGDKREFSKSYFCSDCRVEVASPEQSRFSYNHPFGACEDCQGFGRVQKIDWSKVIPDHGESLRTQGIKPFNFGRHSDIYELFYKQAKKIGLDIDKPFSRYSQKDWSWLRSGDGQSFEGIEGYFRWLERKKYKAHYRIHLARFQHYPTCTSCDGKRFNRSVTNYRVLDKSLVEVLSLSVDSVWKWLHQVESRFVGEAGSEDLAIKDVLSEGLGRCGVLRKIGLSYLTLDRVTGTLSGGEAQRIGVARCLGSQLTETLYCLDEPTCGLHARDSRVLLELLQELRDQGNTVVVVEHDEEIIKGADQLVVVGPGAGHVGGHLIDAKSKTAGKHSIPKSPSREGRLTKTSMKSANFFRVEGISIHNLQGVDVSFPKGKLTVVCGVSGSGKTSLVLHSILPLFSALFSDADHQNKDWGRVKGLSKKEGVEEIYHISQTPLSGSSRSNICTYLGIFDVVRKLFASQDRAKELKLKPGSFSFNSPGGRCEECKGMGYIIQDLSFLGEMPAICSVCKGRRFDDDVLSVMYKGLNLVELLNLTVAQAAEVFFDVPAIRRVLDEAIRLGLDYVPLGQNTSTFSGGEGQRLKLLSLLKESTKSKSRKPIIFIFDEPTTGLSDLDVEALIEVLRDLTRSGHTVMVVEHHLNLIRAADWLIEVGPGAAADGGKIVFQGPPLEIGSIKDSPTRPFVCG